MAIITVTQPNTTVVVTNGDTVIVNIPGGGTVTIQAAPGANTHDIKVKFVGDDQADTVKFDLSTFSTSELHIDIIDYDPTDTIALIGGFNRYVEPGNEDEYNFSYIGSDGNTYHGFLRAKDQGEKDFTNPDQPINICFGAGAIIDTSLGPRPVESLLVGDLVRTQANGLQRIRWIGKRQLDSIDLTRHPQLCPVIVGKGAMGNGRPYKTLMLSQQHRVQISDWRSEFLFGRSSVLVSVKHLVNGKDIRVDEDVPSVCYYHLLFDEHEIVMANGVPAESLHTGDMAMNALDDTDRSEIQLLFPELAKKLTARVTASMVLRSFEAQAIRAYC